MPAIPTVAASEASATRPKWPQSVGLRGGLGGLGGGGGAFSGSGGGGGGGGGGMRLVGHIRHPRMFAFATTHLPRPAYEIRGRYKKRAFAVFANKNHT
jgi:hypothetical protein